MASTIGTIQIKRRNTGASGSPATLKSGELAYSAVDKIIWIGSGDDGAGNATSIEVLGGSGSFVTLTSTQTISGNKTFSGAVVLGSSATASTPVTSDNTTAVATTAFVKAQNYLTANQTITVTGDATGTGTTAIALTLANSGVTAGTYTKVTVDARGIITTGTTLIPADIPTLTASKISDFETTAKSYTLDTFAKPLANIDMNGFTLTNLPEPTQATHPATKNYVDLLNQGLRSRATVRAATLADITLSGLQVVDGVSLLAGDFVLVQNQTASADNGIYTVAAGAWTRATEYNTYTQLVNAYVFVQEGTVNADNGFVTTNNSGGTLGTTPVLWSQFTGAGQVIAGAGLTKTGNQIDIGTASSARIVVNADNLDLATTGVTGGIYTSVTVDTYGRVTAATSPTTLVGYGITDAQPLNVNLTSISGVTAAADKVPYFTGATTAAVADFTATGRSIVAAASVAAARTVLGLGTIATQDASAVALTGGTITGVTISVDVDGGTF